MKINEIFKEKIQKVVVSFSTRFQNNSNDTELFQPTQSHIV